MFTHVTVGANDLVAARAFYDAVLPALGYKRLFDQEDRSGYGADRPLFFVVQPIDGNPASYGNGSTIGLIAKSRTAVNEFHKQALARGGKCEGPPGPRPFGPNVYAAYIRDPVGNKLAAICSSPQ